MVRRRLASRGGTNAAARRDVGAKGSATKSSMVQKPAVGAAISADAIGAFARCLCMFCRLHRPRSESAQKELMLKKVEGTRRMAKAWDGSGEEESFGFGLLWSSNVDGPHMPISSDSVAKATASAAH